MDCSDIRDGLLQLFTADPVNWAKWVIVFTVVVLGYVGLIKSKFVDRLYHKWEYRRDKAVALGHVCEAVLVKSTPSTGGDDPCCGTYAYSFGGETRQYKAMFYNRSRPPETLHLYYIRNPKRPFSPEEHHWDGFTGLLLVIINLSPLLLGALMVWLLEVDTSGF